MNLKLQFTGVKHFVKVAPVCLLLISNVSFAQDAEVKEEKKGKEKKEKVEKDSGKIGIADKKAEAVKYRRSSLHTMIIEDEKLPKKDLLLSTFNEAPFPDKYNDHTIGEKSFNIKDYIIEKPVVEGEKAEKEDKDLSPAISEYFAKNKVANKIVAKWFDRSEAGGFKMDLIGERGLYDASAQSAAVASGTERGTSMLADAGEELIPSTFVVVNYSKFVSNEVAALAAKNIAVAAAAKLPAMAQNIAIKGAEAVYEKTRQGYSVWTTAYLYQLVWNDSTSAVFYQSLWMDDSNIDPAKKEAFDNTDLFQLKLLGFQKASSFISGMGKNAQDEDMIIKNATLKSIDAVYAKLQRKFEPFRTKTPLVSSDPLGAKIGMKEGLEGGDKYEVLEQITDAEGKVSYKRKGTISVDKKKIWDNRYAAGEEPLDEDGNPIAPLNNLEYTHFKGGKGYYPGMLIRQIN
ncbi:hypothetical protein FRY74_05845 [Vicingus serpentipes]|uniref:Uncharacterized protein n=1 Tax=Vicingus serpentipes TaxID=1926625 RepID=A0A5C6RXL3_9FLAO|nr:hypothetical protein [Vicingus serpentipes]TXB66092.1 hypothetical protein FRY74_05845 [Vicingus serpentipes]